MKRFITLLFVFAFLHVNAQVVLQESFDDTPLPGGTGQDYPTGWKATSKVTSKSIWRIKTSFPIGGGSILPTERKYLVGFDSINPPTRAFDEWLTSKEFTLLNTSRTNTVSFYSYHVADGSHSLQINDVNTSTWNTLWVDTNTANPYPDKCLDSTRLEVVIPDSYKGKTVKLAWVFQSSSLTSAWAIDHITCEAVIGGIDVLFIDFKSPLNHEDTINSIPINTDIPIRVRVMNNGRTDAENVPISYTLNNGTPVNDVIPLVKAKETLEFTFNQSVNLAVQAINTLSVATNASNDELVENNTSEIISFWTVNDSLCLIYDFEDPNLTDSALWANSGYVVYNIDQQSPGIQSYENIFRAGAWVVGVGGNYLYNVIWGNFSAFTYSYFSHFPTPADRWLVLPKCRINNTSEPVFLQWNAVSCYQNDHTSPQFESYEVLISENSNAMEDFVKVHEIQSEKYFNPSDPYKPYNRSIDISAYKGKKIFIAYRLTTSGTQTRGMLALDNIKVFGDAVIEGDAINETNTDQTVEVYPNPANNFMAISSQNLIQKIEIYNLLGERIQLCEPNQTNYNISVNDFNNGLYLIKIKTHKGETVKKINIVK